MKRAPVRSSKALSDSTVADGRGGTIPRTLPAALQGQAGRDGESIFATALRNATAEHIARAEHRTGPLDVGFCIDVYQRTQNPLWLWIGLAGTRGPGDIPPEIFQYLRQVADGFFKGVLDQVTSLERVRITPGSEIEEGVKSLQPNSPPSPNIAAVLGLSSPGRNLFQSVARDLRAISSEVAIDDLIHQPGSSQERAQTMLAIALGRTSLETGPATETVRKFASDGRKLLRKRRPESSG